VVFGLGLGFVLGFRLFVCLFVCFLYSSSLVIVCLFQHS
jgi:hypothetical protein